MGDLLQILEDIDWSRYQILRTIAYDMDDMHETVSMTPGACSPKAQRLLQTRCLLSNELARFILDRRNPWSSITTSTIDLNLYTAISIEIDVTRHLDHMFILLNVARPGMAPEWYIIQSYIGKYPTIMETIDAEALLNDMRRWEQYGVDPHEWHQWFHAMLPVTKPYPKVYIHMLGTRRSFYDSRGVASDIRDATRVIDAAAAPYISQYQCYF